MTTRRTFLRGASAAGLGAGVLGGTAAVASSAAASPASASHRRRGIPTFVIAPGSHGNAQYLAGLTGELTARGYRAFVVEPPGHGVEADFPAWYCTPQDPAAMAAAPSAIAGVTLAAAVARMTNAIERAAATGPVVLVGHSLGGATVTATAGTAAWRLLDRMVYVSAYCPVTLPNVTQYIFSPENAGSATLDPTIGAADPSKVGAIRVNWRSGDPVLVEKLRAAYLQNGTVEQLRALAGTLQPDETLRFSTDTCNADADTWGRVPRTYIKFTQDGAMPIALQNRMIREADALTPHNPFDVRELPMTHLGLCVDPNPVADILTEYWV